ECRFGQLCHHRWLVVRQKSSSLWRSFPVPRRGRDAHLFEPCSQFRIELLGASLGDPDWLARGPVSGLSKLAAEHLRNLHCDRDRYLNDIRLFELQLLPVAQQLAPPLASLGKHDRGGVDVVFGRMRGQNFVPSNWERRGGANYRADRVDAGQSLAPNILIVIEE